MRGTCPNCIDDDVESSSRELGDNGGLEVAFDCPNCGHTWTVVF